MSKLIIIFITACVMIPSIYAQNATISGNIKNQRTGENLPSATVTISEVPKKAGSAVKGTVADKTGAFIVRDIPPGTYRLTVSYVGYKKHEETIAVRPNDNLTRNIGLYPDVIGLGEVIVTGVATRREKAVSDISVSRVDAGELQKGNTYENLSQMLQGKVSGVQVQNTTGNVGGGIRFQMRGGGGLNGNGQPVVYVDGARINRVQNYSPIPIGGQDVSTLADIEPEDIASVEILKGPAGGALYGTSGSNGVVLITTKSGRGQNDYLNINYRSNMGWNELPEKYSTSDFISADITNSIFRKGYITEHVLGASGKSGVFSYFFDYSTRNEDGIILQNKLSRQSLKGTFDIMPSGEVHMKFSGNYIKGDNFRPQNDNNLWGWLGNVMISPQAYGNTDSAAIANLQTTLNTHRFIGSVNVDYIPAWLPGLSAHGVIGYDGLNLKDQQFMPPEYYYPSVGYDGRKTIYQCTVDNINYDGNLSYNYNVMTGLEATTILGAQAYDRNLVDHIITSQDFASGEIINVGAAEDTAVVADGVESFREAGVYLQQDINYNQTYYLTLAVRNDYSSVISANAPNIFYPRISGAVRLDKLEILPGFMNFLKARFGYGESGQLPDLRAATPLRWYGYKTGSGIGVDINTIGNPGIQPERIREIEAGIEFEILNSYGIDFTYYVQNADKSIVYIANAPSTGLTQSTVPMNLGSVRIWGLESSVYANPLQTENYSLNLKLILNYQNNKILETGMEQPLITGYGQQGWYDGYKRASWFNYRVTGARFDTNGIYKGPIATTTVEYLGNPLPTFTGSFMTSFSFLKNFTVSGLFEWATGMDLLDNTKMFQVSYGNNVEYNALYNQVVGRNGPPALTPGTPEYKAAAEKLAHMSPAYYSNFIFKGDWLRFRELALRMDLIDYLKPFIGDYVKRFSLAFSVRNLALWSSYPGADPEINVEGGSSTDARGTDLFTLPNPRTFNFSIDLGL